VRFTVFAGGKTAASFHLSFPESGSTAWVRLAARDSNSSGRALSRAGLPEIGSQIEIFHAEASAFADGSFEVFGPGKIVKFGEVAGKFSFVFARDGNVWCGKDRPIRPAERGRGSHGSDRPGNPTERVLFLGDFASGVSRGQGFTRDDNVAIFVGTGVGELVSDVV